MGLLAINTTLYHGDCLDILPSIPVQSIDLILCDLPFGVVACKWDNLIPFDKLWEQYRRVIKPEGVIALFGVEPFSSHLRLSNLQQYKYDWIWEKNTGTNFFHAKRMPIRYTENIHIFYTKFKGYNPQKTTGHVPTNSGIGRYTGQVYHGKSQVNYLGGDTTRYPKNIIKFNTVNNYDRLHPSQKPVDLCEYLIKTYTQEGMTVLDNTMGVGSVGVACKTTHRVFIGIEKDEEYFQLAKTRIDEA
jgi:site-specific DNA-methyltransferase (adenine-specific)